LLAEVPQKEVALLKGKVVLVVDDEEDLRELISEELKLAECRVLTAKNGHEALKIIAENKIDLVITDLRMNNGDGKFIIEGVERLEKHRPKIVVLTGYMGEEDADIVKKAHAVLHKPIKWQNLINIVEQVIAKKKL